MEIKISALLLIKVGHGSGLQPNDMVAGIKKSSPDRHRQNWKIPGLPMKGSLPHESFTWQDTDDSTCSL